MVAMFRPVLTLFVLLSVLTGLAYPLLATGIGRVLFPGQVSGSLVLRDGTAVGSSLIGQSFQEPKYFWGRISATSPMPNNGSGSSGSNLGPTNPALIDAVRGRIDALKAADPQNSLPIPVDLVTASASGLDPHISPAAALYQVTRVARERKLDAFKVRQLVLARVEGPQWWVFGEARVNVLLLNLSLDRAQYP
jgi:potassium-transporting ATPase KdpC subunit